MKKFTFSFKSLLVACGLLLGSANAWGDATLVYGRAVTEDLENGYTAWSASDIGSGKWVASAGTASIDAGSRGLKVAQQRGSARATNSSQISVTANSIITLDAVWNTGYASGGDGENNAFTFGNNIEIRAYTYNQHGDIYINGEFYASITNACKKDVNREHDPWTIHLVVNTGTNKITEFTIRGANGANKATYTLDGTISLSAGSTYNSLTLAHNRTKGNNAAEACYLTSIKIVEEKQEVSTADVTFKYEKTDGTSLSSYRADEVASDVTVGTEISSLISSYATTFYNGTSNKYVYANSYVVTGSYTTVQDGGNTVTLKFTDYPATAYTVMAQEGGSDLTSIASGTAYLDGSTTAYYSKYVKYNDQWYETSSPYGVAVSAATTNVAYTTCETNDIYDVIECENTSYNSAGDATGTGYSKGKTVLLASGKAMQTNSKLPVGIYDFSVFNSVRRSNVDRLKLQYSINGSDWTDLATLTFPSNDGTTQTAEKVVLAEDSYVRFLDDVGQNSCHYYDYILIKKYVPVTISAAGYATFSSEYALDLTTANTPAGLTAYYINSTELTKDNAPFTTIDQTVAAGQGILLKGDEGTYNIKVAASGDALADNALVATNGSAITAGNYVFAYETAHPSTTAGFYYVSVNTAPVATGKAYLDGSLVPTNVKAFIFDGTTTGIETAPAAEAEEDGVYYNTAGQVVTKDYKGIVIKNGKKYFNK